MRRTRLVLAGALLIVFAGGLAVAGCSSDDSSSGEDQTAASTPAETVGNGGSSGPAGSNAGQAQPDGNAGSSQPGRYVDYSPELVESTPGDKLLFFHADWCSQCQALEEDIESSGVPDGVTIFKVDYDSNQDLRQQYGVTIQTTIVKVDDDGEMIDSYVAYEDPTLENVTNALVQ